MPVPPTNAFRERIYNMPLTPPVVAVAGESIHQFDSKFLWHLRGKRLDQTLPFPKQFVSIVNESQGRGVHQSCFYILHGGKKCFGHEVVLESLEAESNHV